MSSCKCWSTVGLTVALAIGVAAPATAQEAEARCPNEVQPAISGTAQSEILNGTSGADRILALAGDDQVSALQGDTVFLAARALT